MVKNKNDICPYCGGELQSRGKVKRILRGDNGSITHIDIWRYSCRECKRWHRVLPNNIIPYKQFSKDIVDGFKSGNKSNDEERYFDYPSEATINRWKRK